MNAGIKIFWHVHARQINYHMDTFKERCTTGRSRVDQKRKKIVRARVR